MRRLAPEVDRPADAEDDVCVLPPLDLEQLPVVLRIVLEIGILDDDEIPPRLADATPADGA